VSNDARILTEDRAGVRLLTFNRPEVLNAFDSAQYEAVLGGIRAASADDTIKVLVLTGAGRAFSAGADLSQMAQPPAADSVEPADRPNYFDLMLQELESFPKPLIAAVNGVGVGIGCTILGHCDMVLLARSSRLRLPFAPLGLAPEAGSTALLPARIGWQRTARTLFVGDWISAELALEWGMALEISDDDKVLAEAMELAALVAQGPLATLMETKLMLLATRADLVAAARVRENAALARLSGSEANRAAVASFMSSSRY
jgi:enoyl-CoA hydratase/carnithine racemase